LKLQVDISPGELLDKISILELKLLKIEDEEKLSNVHIEFDHLNPKVVALFEKFGSELEELYLKLAKVNGELWDIEDAIRLKEKKKEFERIFIGLARSVYKTNDKRSEIKKEINLLTGSNLIEEKSYEEY